MQCYARSNEMSQFHTLQDSQRPSTDKAMPQLKKQLPHVMAQQRPISGQSYQMTKISGCICIAFATLPSCMEALSLQADVSQITQFRYRPTHRILARFFSAADRLSTIWRRFGGHIFFGGFLAVGQIRRIRMSVSGEQC